MLGNLAEFGFSFSGFLSDIGSIAAGIMAK
jgi:hypothetical protein